MVIVPPTNVSNFTQLKKIIFAILMIFAVLVCADHTRRWFHAVPADLRAFYAAGVVVDQHANPLTVQPLFNVERGLPNGGSIQQFVSPVPLPPYDLAALGLLARLPVALATGLMALATLAAGFVTAFALYRAAAIPLTLAIAVAFMATVYSASGLGQIAPIAIAAIALGVWAVREQRYSLAGVAVAISLIQPQIAVAPLACVLLFVPRARIAAIAVLVIEAVASFVFVGPTEILQYVSALAIHARAELHFPAQFSLTWLLTYFGFAPSIALALGSVSTVIAIVASIYFVANKREQALANGAVIALPAAFSVVGGSFIHEHQIALAVVPALLLLRPTARIFDSAWALAALVIPFASFLTLEAYWPNKAAYPSIALAFAICYALTYARAEPLGAAFALWKGAAVTAGLAVVFFGLMHFRPHVALLLPVLIHHASENASIEWATFCEAANAAFHGSSFTVFVKLPVWLSIVTVAICSARNTAKAL